MKIAVFVMQLHYFGLVCGVTTRVKSINSHMEVHVVACALLQHSPKTSLVGMKSAESGRSYVNRQVKSIPIEW